MGEAIQILLSKDQLLNRKNEYIQNCISRITAQEDLYQRKARLLQEEAEERQLETDIQQFKAQKRRAKRKTQEDLITNKRLILADGIETRTFHKAGEDVADPPKMEVGREMAGSQKLASLRERMESEKSRVLEYLERKNSHESDLILEDIEKLWRQTEEGKRETGRREPDDLLPEGWTNWWKLIYHQFSQAQRAEKITRSGNKKKDFSERFLPNQLLLGWKGWWSRMGAESRRDLEEKQRMKLKMKISRIKPIDIFLENFSSNSSGQKINSVQKFS